jgi:hypothetical protein
VRGRARAAAARAKRDNEELVETLGRSDDVEIRMRDEGRIFGGTLALEIASAHPVLPPTAGLTGRARGALRMTGVSFRAKRGDKEGAALARRLEEDRELGDALSQVHFEGIRVDPDGRAVIRHMGGSVVWVLFPPFVRAVPLIRQQAEAAVAALDAFAQAGKTLAP